MEPGESQSAVKRNKEHRLLGRSDQTEPGLSRDITASKEPISEEKPKWSRRDVVT